MSKPIWSWRCLRERLKNTELHKRIKLLEDVLKEVAKEPYPDSDLSSLLKTLRCRAQSVLEEK